MPRGDGTGPTGMGPMTGRGAGYCAGGFRNVPMRGGMGYGRGFGFRRAQGWGAPGYYSVAPNYLSQEEERDILLQQTQALEREVQYMKERLRELEGERK